MEESKKTKEVQEKQIATFNALVVHPNAGFTVKGILLNTLQEAEEIEGLVICKIYKDGVGAATVWSDQPINQLVFLNKVFDIDLTEALFQARAQKGG